MVSTLFLSAGPLSAGSRRYRQSESLVAGISAEARP